MIRRGWMLVSMIFLAMAFAVAATEGSSVAGHWEAKSRTANGEVTVTFNFEVQGQVLTGTTETPAGTQSIDDGKVSGSKISFKTTINGNVIDHQGTISGDTIQMKNKGPFGEFDFLLKRVAGEK